MTGGRPGREPGSPLNPPIVMASTYVAGDPGAAYGRWTNPVWTSFEQALGDLEGGVATVFSSGMAAVNAVLEHASSRPGLPAPGGVVVVPDGAYSGTLALLPPARYVRVDIADTAATVAALDAHSGEVAALWIESPTNPALAIADVNALTSAARARGVPTVVDNTFATPVGANPLAAGADVVVHSVTKLLAGHSDLVLGAVVTGDPTTTAALVDRRTRQGSVASPFDTWLALRGLRTLVVRVERACANAAMLAERLVGHPALARVRYPGLPSDPGYERARRTLRMPGSIVCVEFHGGAAVADAFCDAVRLWMPATSLGAVESTLERRRRWPAESASVDESLVRLSVGIEDVEDLWTDLEQALVSATAHT